MSIPPPPPPLRADFLLPNGKISPPWVQWLSQQLAPAVISALQSITLKGDVTGSGGAEIVTTIEPEAVTLGKMAMLPPVRIIGNVSGSDAVPQALTANQVTQILSTFTSTLRGVVPPSGGGTTKYMRADGTWAVPPTSGTAGGDLSGTYPNPTVAGLKGSALPPLPGAGTALLGYNASTGQWTFDASGYATQTWVTTNFLGITAKAADSNKLNGQLASFYQPASTAITTSNIRSQAVASATSLTGGSQSTAITWSNTQTYTGTANFNNIGGNIRLKVDGTGTNDWGIFTAAGGSITIQCWNGITSAQLILGNPVKMLGTVGFNNTNPISKPTVTGSKGSNAALTSLLTALANYGLITDSST